MVAFLVQESKELVLLSSLSGDLFVPNESTKDGKNKSAITKGTKWAECGKKDQCSITHSLN